MNYHVHLTVKSANAKTGPIPVSTTSAATCPPSCPMRAGCYAKSGPLALHWAAVSSGSRGSGWEEFCDAIAALPPGQLWRHNQAGDLPGDGSKIDARALSKLVKANAGKRGFTYTHYPVTAANLRAIRAANSAGFTVNLSANDLQQADEYAAAHGLPVAVVLPKDIHGNADIRTPGGRKVIVCPATYREDTSCATCRLCSVNAPNRPIIGFPAHGTGAKKADAIARKFIPIVKG